MSVKKEQIFTMAAAYDIVRNAVNQVTTSKSANADTIIFNSLNKAITDKMKKRG